jgi:hypothetical protein
MFLIFREGGAQKNQVSVTKSLSTKVLIELEINGDFHSYTTAIGEGDGNVGHAIVILSIK